MDVTQINLNIAHIKDGEEYFQVLNEDGDDWDEESTISQYNQSVESKAQNRRATD